MRVEGLGFGVQGLKFGVEGFEVHDSGVWCTPAPSPTAIRCSRTLCPVAGFRVQGAGFRVQGSVFSVQCLGFRVQGSGFRGEGSGFRVWGGRSQSVFF